MVASCRAAPASSDRNERILSRLTLEAMTTDQLTPEQNQAVDD